MALIAHHTQASYASFPSRSNLQTKEVKPNKQFVSLKLVGRLDRINFSNRRYCLRVQTNLPLKVKHFKVSAFKGSAKNEESGGRSNASKLPKNSVKLSYVPQNEETIAESPNTEQAPISYSSGREENIAGSPAIQKLFQKWLMMLRTQSTNQASDAIFEDEPVQSGILESQSESEKQEGSTVLKAAWCYFLGLDTTVKILLLIFIPWYLAVNVVYGAEVSKELTPLWVLGPVIVALYIKMLQGLCALYVFSFKQTVRLLKSSPTYFLLVYNYVAQGKLKEEFYSRFWQPVVDVKNLNYRKLFKRKLKALEQWAVEKYLDYVESIWPYYCRTIRFLKKANLI
ncbi:hypothetical protein IFM89_017871 [Coptis chinensis]|uniref:Embryo defective 2759 n=1 Tax=Coptis chinensis TaxID=261450 RepID=A0A835IXB6_9MAGN|nr:hypothetical protein IFM89_017871 [Coptis chinensis]